MPDRWQGVTGPPETFAQAIDRLEAELSKECEERKHLEARCQELLMLSEDLETRHRCDEERMKRIESSRDSFREENVILRAQLDIVYLIFGNRSMGGRNADS